MRGPQGGITAPVTKVPFVVTPLTQHTEQEVKKLVDAMPALAPLKANGIADYQIVTLDLME